MKRAEKKSSALCGAYRSVFVLLAVCMLCMGLIRPAAEENDAAVDNSTYRIYYKNAAGDELVSVEYTPQAQTFNDILNELAAQLVTSPSEKAISVLPDGVALLSFTRGVDSLTIDLGSGYLSLGASDQVLLRGGIVNTFVQLPGVTGIRLSVEGQELTNSAGVPFGSMDADTFITSRGDSINSLKQAKLTLYFPEGEGNQVHEEQQTIRYSTNLLPERVVMERLLAGPTEEGSRSLASAETVINSIRIENGICQVDLSAAFNQDTAGTDPEAVITAVVRSLCENTEAGGVVLMIDGSQDISFRGKISLDQVFYPGIGAQSAEAETS